ncbi:MAG: ABC transporter ATP-binding protein [Candidatus Thorarchaeota archaeon]
MSETIIEAKELTRRYGYRVALKKISFGFTTGGVHGLFGSNGAGKSTLMRIISTLLRPQSGSISVFGLDPEEDFIEIKKKIGLIGDKPLLYPELTGRENLEFYCKLYGIEKETVDKDIEKYSRRFGVFKWLDEPTKILSHGLRKRFDIIRCMIHSPDLLLLDEPFSGLDKESSEIFKDYINEYRTSKTVVLTTHNLKLGRDFCDDFMTLRKAEIIAQGPISDFDEEL